MTSSRQAPRLLQRLISRLYSRPHPSPHPRRPTVSTMLARTVAVAGLALLSACGGGTSQVESFVPLRYFAFGDETSTLESNGRKYAVNALDTNNRLDCTQQPIWVQQVAGAYGFVFAECNPGFVSDTRAIMLARAGAKADDVSAQVEAQVAAGGFRDKDLATVLAGANDVLDLYRQYPARSEASLIADARDRGRRLALTVNRLVDLGVKVVIATVPDMGLTPYGKAERRNFNDIDRSAFLSRLTAVFNEQLGVTVVLDGRFVGLVQADLQLQAVDRFPSGFGVGNTSDGVCTVALPQCTTATLLTGADPASFLWADDTRLANAGHAQLAQLAVDRAQRNPF
jgi:outer membrane lipase/esterase